MYTVKETVLYFSIQNNSARALNFINSLSSQECETRTLSKETMAAYSLKSPKLSKALVAMGLPEKVVSQALSTSVLSEVARISSDVNDLLEMGDSKHYKSCQSAGNPLRAVEELIPYLGKSLWLLVVGQRMSINGKGFVARRLLRLMYKDRLCTEPAGVYIDRVYGDPSLLPKKVIYDFFGLPILSFSYEASALPPLYCPSALHGYNDTLVSSLQQFSYTPLEYRKMSLTQFAYSNREKRGRVYLCSIAENIYNPQNGRFSPPPLPTPWRGLISKEERLIIDVWIGLFGYPRQNIKRMSNAVIISCTSFVGKIEVKVIKDGNKVFSSVVGGNIDPIPKFLEIQGTRIEVKRDVKELGFFKPVSLLSKLVVGKDTLTEEDLELVNFWIDTFGYPVDGETFSLSHQNAFITYRGIRYIIRYYGGAEISIILQQEERHLFTYYPLRKESRVLLSMTELGFEEAVSIKMGEATSVVSSLLGFCPVRVGQYFTFGDHALCIEVSSTDKILVDITKPGEKFGDTFLVIEEGSLLVGEDCPELGFWAAVPWVTLLTK
jgi:hypothetical protein